MTSYRLWLGIVLTLALFGCGEVAPPDVPFLEHGDSYDSKPDFARVEHEAPLGPADSMKLTPQNLAALSQEQVDQVYARLTAGPIQDGANNGSSFFGDGGGVKRFSELMGGLKGLAVRLYCGQSLLDSRRASIIIDYAYNDEIAGYRERPGFLAGRRGLKIRDEIRMVRPGFYLGRAYMGHVFLLNFTLYNEQVADAGGEAFAQTGEVREECWPGTQRLGRLAALGN